MMEHFCIDAHTHLIDPVFNTTIDSIVQEAVDKDVKAAVVVTESVSDFEPVLQLHKRFPNFAMPCLGIHPIQSSGKTDERGLDIKRSVNLQDYENVEQIIEEHLDRIVGIGEIGLDFTPRFCSCAEDKENQKVVFSKQVQLAQKYDLPVNVHSRSAGNHAIQILKELGARNVLLHAFDGRASVAVDGASHGYYFSVPSSIGRDPQIQKMVKCLPIDRLMVETDSPAIAPVKGETNKPVNVILSCEHIAKIKSMDVKQVMQITTGNTLKLFPRIRPLLGT